MYGIWCNFQDCEDGDLIDLGNYLLNDIANFDIHNSCGIKVSKSPLGFSFSCSDSRFSPFGNGDGIFTIEFYCTMDIINGDFLATVYFCHSPWSFKVGIVRMNIGYRDTHNKYYNYIEFKS